MVIQMAITFFWKIKKSTVFFRYKDYIKQTKYRMAEKLKNKDLIYIIQNFKECYEALLLGPE